jgi:NTP pyrophosphatase (non-canonical NTP hydrolase)
MRDSVDLRAIASRLEDFAREREWEQFHDPKNLSMAIAVESGELLEIFQWLTPRQASLDGDAARLRKAAEELADILIYAIRMADILHIDLAEAIDRKIESNRLRYPADEVKGSAVKRD